MAEKNNINLNLNTKQRFTIDGDRHRVVEIDTHDLALVNRLSESIKKMNSLKDKWEKLGDVGESIDTEGEVVDEALLKGVADFSDQFAVIEAQMREIVDYIFDCEGLCQTVLGNSSIFSPVNGVYKFEQIIDVFTALYEDTIEVEAKKLNKRTVETKTSKYIRNKK